MGRQPPPRMVSRTGDLRPVSVHAKYRACSLTGKSSLNVIQSDSLYERTLKGISTLLKLRAGPNSRCCILFPARTQGAADYGRHLPHIDPHRTKFFAIFPGLYT